MSIDEIKDTCKIYLIGGVTNSDNFFSSIPLKLDLKALYYVRKCINERIKEIRSGEP